MGKMFLNARHIGASNVMSAAGADVNQATRSTAEAFVSGWGGRNLLSFTGQAAGERVWVAAFLEGSGSTPARWEAKRVDLAGHGVRVVYAEVRRRCISCDIHPCFVWANLGTLEAGDYLVELTADIMFRLPV